MGVVNGIKGLLHHLGESRKGNCMQWYAIYRDMWTITP